MISPAILLSTQIRRPSLDQVRNHFMGTLTHVFHIEYYLQRLQIASEDDQRPHDIIGPGNKLLWPVIESMAFQDLYGEVPEDIYDGLVGPAVKLHREGQNHHRVWQDAWRLNCEHSDKKLELSALDAVCSWFEPHRKYQGGIQTQDQIVRNIRENPERRRKLLEKVYSEMIKVKELDAPNFSVLQNPTRFPNVGRLNPWTYDTIRQRFSEALQEAKKEGYEIKG